MPRILVFYYYLFGVMPLVAALTGAVAFLGGISPFAAAQSVAAGGLIGLVFSFLIFFITHLIALFIPIED